MTNIDTLRNIAGANWTNQYIDRDLNLPGRCAFGRVIQLLVKFTKCDFLRSSLNSLCSVDIATTADKLTSIMQRTLCEAAVESLDDTRDVVRRAAENFNKIAVKTNNPKIDVEAIINNPAPASASTPSITPSSVAAVNLDAAPEQQILNVEKDADPVADEQPAALNDASSDAASSAAIDPNPAVTDAHADADADTRPAAAPVMPLVCELATGGHDSASESGTDSDAKPIRRRRLGTSVRTPSKPKNPEGHGVKSARINAKHK